MAGSWSAMPEWDEPRSRVVRVNTNGSRDPTFVCTNQIYGYVMALLPQPDGSVLFGGSIYDIDGVARLHLVST